MTERTPHIWTRINPDDPDTWPRPGNLVLVANDFGAVLNLRSFGALDSDGVLDGDGGLVLGLVCELSDRCLFEWRSA